jgi:hypothetical protein
MYTLETVVTIHGITQTLAEHAAANVISLRYDESGSITGWVTLSGGDNGAAFAPAAALTDATPLYFAGEDAMTLAQAEERGIIAVQRDEQGKPISYARLA